MASQDALNQQLDAQLRETDARLNLLQSQAEARHAKDEMDEITGLRAARDRASQTIAGVLQDLQVKIEQASDRYGAWDAARERRFQARLAEAEAQQQIWNAQTDAHQAAGEIQYENEVATLKQQVETAKTKYKDWKARTNQQTQKALAAASQDLDTTLNALAQKFNT
jgi:hypothetical protein